MHPTCPKCDSNEKITYCYRQGQTSYTCNKCGCDFYEDGFTEQTNFDLHKRIRALEIRLQAKEATLQILQDQIGNLETKFNEIYYAPGMPGYVQAANEFSNNS